MPKINGVALEYGEGTGLSCAILDIHLSNGQIIWLSLKPVVDDARFTYMRAEPHKYIPKTDGWRVYWPDGPSLSFDEIMEMVVR